MVVGDTGAPVSHTVWKWLVSHSWPGWRVEVLTADETEIQWGEPATAVAWDPPWARSATIPEAEVSYLKVASDPRPMLGSRSDADLIVVGRTGFRRTALLGGTSEWLVNHPPAPLVIIANDNAVSEVTVCADGSEHATAAIEVLAGLPFASECEVTVLSVDDGRTDAGAAAAAAVEVLAGRVASVEVEIVKDNPTRAIINHMESAAPDLLVVGTKGLTGWQRIRLGSTAGAVARSATCNLLVGSAEL